MPFHYELCYRYYTYHVTLFPHSYSLLRVETTFKDKIISLTTPRSLPPALYDVESNFTELKSAKSTVKLCKDAPIGFKINKTD